MKLTNEQVNNLKRALQKEEQLQKQKQEHQKKIYQLLKQIRTTDKRLLDVIRWHLQQIDEIDKADI